MNGINLFPWRLEKYRQLLFLFLLKMFSVWAVAFLLYAVLSWFQHQQKEALNLQLKQFEQQKSRLTQTVQNIAKMKQDIQNLTELQAIESDTVEQVLSLLPRFPFQQGELEIFNLNEERIQLNGFCLSQQEFESLHEFLSSHFSTVKLTQFKTEQGRLVFQFDLSLEMTGGGK
ncbi:hypothetical protein PHA51_07935 [Rodentibacter pneumotropicus]|uniref:PilN domain-containing protein n=1 Tax=Rodentibacter pneumotropicus TaxID=758 RepID=UPI00232D605E|nr:hypothetical protein [Rodentibacter pneumotropicus]MDC2825953.1 hypothetical protein [Rodentibacter pneumotropicus]